MARTVAIGIQNFENIIENNCFYVDKTGFIREWWENMDAVTLITRPRRFGKTLTMNMVERFFSVKYKGQGEIFSGLKIWEDEKYRKLQGSYPVLSLSFADVKESTYEGARAQIFQIISDLYTQNEFLRNSGVLSELNNLAVVTSTSNKHETVFGFTQEEKRKRHLSAEK